MKEKLSKEYARNLSGRLYGLLCEFEKDGTWEKFLDSILIELIGIPEEFHTSIFYTLYYKLSTLRYVKYEYFRRNVFDSIELLKKM